MSTTISSAVQYAAPRTSSDLVLQSLSDAKQSAYGAAAQEASGQEYTKTSKMTQALSDMHSSLTNNQDHVKKLQENAQNFLYKTAAAETSLKRMQTAVNQVSTLLAGNATITPQNRAAMQTSVQNALQTIQNELNSPFTNGAAGGYLWASSANTNQAPTSGIVTGVSYNATNGTANANYAVAQCASNQVTVADGVNFNADMSPTDPSISNTIAALQMIRDALASNQTTIPAAATTLLQTGISGLANFEATIKIMSQNTQNAMDTNSTILDQIEQQLDMTFAADPIKIATATEAASRQIGSSVDLLAALKRLPDLLSAVSR